jgi:hypothetical protein
MVFLFDEILYVIPGRAPTGPTIRSACAKRLIYDVHRGVTTVMKPSAEGAQSVGATGENHQGQRKCGFAFSQQKPAGLVFHTGGPEGLCYFIIARA